jgi:murein tripeptide amidase MpaA
VVEEEKQASISAQSQYFAGFNLEAYHQYNEIQQFVQQLASQNPSKARVINIGTTGQGKSITGLTINDGTPGVKEQVMLECGIHAREWVSPATCLWIANDLLTGGAIAKFAKYEFTIIPSANPDGYVYTWTTNRIWRKNLSKSRKIGAQDPNQGQYPPWMGQRPVCLGADPNRNFDSYFCRTGASPDPCADTYCGDGPFSEPESRALRDIILKLAGPSKDKLKAYFAIHAFSQLWMYPYGYTQALPRDAQLLDRLSQLAVTAIRNTYGETFKYGNIARVIYEAAGASVDWAYDKAGVKIAYALELRDRGQYGFVLPPQLIKPTAIEAWNGIKAVLQAI